MKKKSTPLYKALQNKEFFKEFTKNLPVDSTIGDQVLLMTNDFKPLVIIKKN